MLLIYSDKFCWLEIAIEYTEKIQDDEKKTFSVIRTRVILTQYIKENFETLVSQVKRIGGNGIGGVASITRKRMNALSEFLSGLELAIRGRRVGQRS